MERLQVKRSLLVGSLLLVSCGDRPPDIAVPPTSAWTFQSSPGMSAPVPNATGGVYFAFPPQDGVHYLVRAPAGALQGTMVLDIDVAIGGNPTYVSSDPTSTQCDLNPKVGLYFQRQGDQGTAAFQFYRWFSNERYVIISGPGNLSVPLSPDKWGQVFGINGAADDQTKVLFAQALATPMAVGMTFGVGCFAGHGIYVTGGTVVFTINRFEIR